MMAFSPSLPLGVLFLCGLTAVHGYHVRVTNLNASYLYGGFFSDPDPYVKVWCGAHFGGMTEVAENTRNPSWHAEFNFVNVSVGDELTLDVWDRDVLYDDHLGTCTTNITAGTNEESCSLN